MSNSRLTPFSSSNAGFWNHVNDNRAVRSLEMSKNWSSYKPRLDSSSSSSEDQNRSSSARKKKKHKNDMAQNEKHRALSEELMRRSEELHKLEKETQKRKIEHEKFMLSIAEINALKEKHEKPSTGISFGLFQKEFPHKRITTFHEYLDNPNTCCLL